MRGEGETKGGGGVSRFRLAYVFSEYEHRHSSGYQPCAVRIHDYERLWFMARVLCGLTAITAIYMHLIVAMRQLNNEHFFPF